MLATRVQLLPEVVDLSFVPTAAGLGSLLLILWGVSRGHRPDRVVRLGVLGTVVGGIGATVAIGIVAAIQ